jgi:hypothetical protein
MGELVSLYRCKQCGVRMFESHTRTHLRQHTDLGDVSDGYVLLHFERGPKDTSSTPGGQATSYGRAAMGKGGRRKGKVSATPTDDTLETVEDEPVTTLADLVEG